MKLTHWFEVLGDSCNVVSGLWVGLMALIVWDEKGEKFVEPNTTILTGEAFLASMMTALGIERLIKDIPHKNPIEILGDLSIVAGGVGMLWLFYQLYNGGITIPYYIPLLMGGVAISIYYMTIGIERLINGLSNEGVS